MYCRYDTPTMATPRAVLFDFDYTLADSSAGIIECTNHALTEMGLPLVGPAAVCKSIGLSLDRMFREFTGSDGEPEQAATFQRLFVAHADQVMLGHTRLYSGVPALVAELVRRGIRLAVVTTKFAYRITEVLDRDGISGAFVTIVGRESVLKAKPDPQGVRLALATLDCSPDDAIFVGDSLADEGAAAAAGVPFLAVLTGTTPEKAFSTAQKLLPRVSCLTEWLDKDG